METYLQEVEPLRNYLKTLRRRQTVIVMKIGFKPVPSP